MAVLAVFVLAIVGGVGAFFWRMQTEAAKLVECGSCHAFIPENALKCPKCNTEFETEVVKCSACGAWIPPQSMDCPKCGVSFKKRALSPRARGAKEEREARKEGKETTKEQRPQDKEKPAPTPKPSETAPPPPP